MAGSVFIAPEGVLRGAWRALDDDVLDNLRVRHDGEGKYVVCLNRGRVIDTPAMGRVLGNDWYGPVVTDMGISTGARCVRRIYRRVRWIDI